MRQQYPHRFHWLLLGAAIGFGAPQAAFASTYRFDPPPPIDGTLISEDPARAPRFQTPIGLGALTGNSGGRQDYTVVVEGQNHFQQLRGKYGLRQYGQGEARLELGNAAGVTLSASSGILLLPSAAAGAVGVHPHLGVEPFSGRIGGYLGGSRSSSYEWTPMASAGVQLATGSCRVLPLVRAGGSAGNLNGPGLWPAFGFAYGAASYLNCSRVDLAVEANRVKDRRGASDLGVIDLSYQVTPDRLRLGVRGESELGRDSDGSPRDRADYRVLLLLRGQLLD